MSIPTILGSTGNDRLVGAKNDLNDTIDGLTGMDVVTYGGKSTEYNFTVNDGVFMVTDAPNTTNHDGSDSLINIEKIIFQGDKQQLSASTESIANVDTSGDQTETSVLALPGGGFINFWYGKVSVTTSNVDATTGVETTVTTETLGYYFRKFDKNGVAVIEHDKDGNPINNLDKKIIADPDGKMSGFKPAIQSNGDIVIAWSEPDADKNGIAVQIFNPDGTEKSVKFLANDTLTDDQLQPALAVLPDDSIVVAWTSSNQGDSLQHNGVPMGGTPNQAGVFSQHFDSSGNPLGWETKVSESGGGDAFVTALDDGNYVICHEGIEAGTERMSITASFFNQDDVKQYPDVPVNQTPESIKATESDPVYNELASREKLPTAAKLNDGNVIMVWQAPRDAYSPPEETHNAHDMNIIACLFTPTGGDISSEFVVTTFTDNAPFADGNVTQYDQTQPAVAALADGGFVVVWQSMLQDGSYWGIYGQRFAANGDKVGNEFQVNGKSQDSQQQPSVTALSEAEGGGFVVSWQAQYQDGNQQGSSQSGSSANEIVQQRYDKNGNPLGNTYAGGNGDDTITITGSSDIEIDGGLGDDKLTSGDGNDTLRGGSGNDTFDAGIGNNTIIGGDGADILKLAGTLADYTITGSNGKYLIEGKVGTTYESIHDNLSTVEIVNFLGDNSQYTLSGDQSGGTQGHTYQDLITDGTLPGQPMTLPIPSESGGNNGDDTLIGGNTKGAADTLMGGTGNDLYIALGNYLIIYDTAGIDTLRIASTIDLSNPLSNKKTKGLDYIENVELTGKANLNLIGSASDNKLTGNDGNNKISGGLGNDTLYGGLGKDMLTGGAGLDRFVFNTTPTAKNADTITDFNGDKIVLDSSIYLGLDGNGDHKITADQLLSGAGRKTADTDAASFLVYDTTAGNLYYDAKDAPAVLIAKVGIYDVSATGKLTTFHPVVLTVDNFEIL
jgi:hypothetical protein